MPHPPPRPRICAEVSGDSRCGEAHARGPAPKLTCTQPPHRHHLQSKGDPSCPGLSATLHHSHSSVSPGLCHAPRPEATLAHQRLSRRKCHLPPKHKTRSCQSWQGETLVRLGGVRGRTAGPLLPPKANLKGRGEIQRTSCEHPLFPQKLIPLQRGLVDPSKTVTSA